MATSAPAVHRVSAITDPVRVMVVDDSVVTRTLISRWIDEDRELAVVATHRNGRFAVDDIERSDPDVVVLDIDMPEMDGLTALPLMLKKKPSLVVVMVSTLTRRNAEISIKALSLGASDYVPKPESTGGALTSADFRREILEKVRVLGHRARRPHPAAAGRPHLAPAGRDGGADAPHGVAGLRTRAAAPDGLKLRSPSPARPRILAIGSSTGGPRALETVFGAIGPAIDAIPVVVVQHLPATFTTILAEHIGKSAGRPAREGRSGEPLEPGHIYVAPGGKHMRVRGGATPVLQLDERPAINYCRPAVDPLFDSVAEIYGAGALAVVLTGMGTDGAKGAVTIADAGGTVIAQDEATSVVWGMPGAAAHAGACAAVLPLSDIGQKLTRLISGDRA